MFENHKDYNHVYKLSNVLYGLKQATTAWYERLEDFLIEKGFKIEGSTLHYPQRSCTMISSFIKFMLMTLFLAQQMKGITKN
jgi:hypothetical protein